MGLENPLHLMIVLLVALLVFGAKRLPDMGRSMGEGMRSFKDAISGESPVAHPVGMLTPAPVATPADPVALTAPDAGQEAVETPALTAVSAGSMASQCEMSSL